MWKRWTCSSHVSRGLWLTYGTRYSWWLSPVQKSLLKARPVQRVENVLHPKEASKVLHRHLHRHPQARESGVGAAVEGRWRELDSMAITAAVVRSWAAVAMGTVPPTAVTMRTVLKTHENTKAIQQYALTMISQISQVIQERKPKMVIQQMAAVEIPAESEIQVVLLHPRTLPCFPKEAIFHYVPPSCHLLMPCQHMHSIQQVLTTFQLFCILVFHYQCLPPQHLMSMDKCHFQWFPPVLEPLACHLKYQAALVCHSHTFIQGYHPTAAKDLHWGFRCLTGYVKILQGRVPLTHLMGTADLTVMTVVLNHATHLRVLQFKLTLLQVTRVQMPMKEEAKRTTVMILITTIIK